MAFDYRPGSQPQRLNDNVMPQQGGYQSFVQKNVPGYASSYPQSRPSMMPPGGGMQPGGGQRMDPNFGWQGQGRGQQINPNFGWQGQGGPRPITGDQGQPTPEIEQLLQRILGQWQYRR